MVVFALSGIPLLARAEPTAEGTYTLEQLIRLAEEHYPGIAVARHALDSMQRKQFQAHWAWLPRGTVKGFFAPTPEIRCIDPRNAIQNPTDVPQDERERACVSTDVRNLSLNFNGVFGRIELEIAMPLYTFDKLGAVQRAANAGVDARTAGVEVAEQTIALNVSKAYWGLKLADEMAFTIREGKKHLDGAHERLQKQLDEDDAEATITDQLRLKTAAAEVNARLLEAERLTRVARDALALLTGLSPERLRIDASAIAAMSLPLADLQHFTREAQRLRPELKMIAAGMRASQAKMALERARLWPDFLLVGRLGIGGATNIDDPRNAFFNDPFNFISSGLGLALNWNLNTVEQYGRYTEAAANAHKVAAQQREALLGIELELRKIYAELQEARERLKVTEKGSKAARSWLVATSQNMGAGLAEARELTDALVAYFQLELRYLQAIFDVNVGWCALARTTGLPIRQFLLQSTQRQGEPHGALSKPAAR